MNIFSEQRPRVLSLEIGYLDLFCVVSRVQGSRTSQCVEFCYLKWCLILGTYTCIQIIQRKNRTKNQGAKSISGYKCSEGKSAVQCRDMTWHVVAHNQRFELYWYILGSWHDEPKWSEGRDGLFSYTSAMFSTLLLLFFALIVLISNWLNLPYAKFPFVPMLSFALRNQILSYFPGSVRIVYN